MSVVTGASKLVQDLACAILEPMGDDPLHPTYGSVLDGGVDVQGNVHQGFIGGLNNQTAAVLAGTEVRRICQAHQAQQIARNHADVSTYGRSTLTAGEALTAVQNITVTQVIDQMMIKAALQTGSGPLPIAIPISTQ